MGSVSELSLHFDSFFLQFFSQTISKLEEVIGGTFVSVHGLHHLFEEFVLGTFLLSVFGGTQASERRLVIIIFIIIFLNIISWGACCCCPSTSWIGAALLCA